jgi:hypothetical protein
VVQRLSALLDSSVLKELQMELTLRLLDLLEMLLD